MQELMKITLAAGEVKIKLFEELAPKHVTRIKELVRTGFYDGLTFHRVIEGFVAQAGCPNGDGTGRSGQSIAAEFTNTPFKRGVVGMARGFDKDSGDSQFFICLEDCDSLNGQYTVWGEVISGMEYIDSLKRGEMGRGAVFYPDIMQKVEIIEE